MVRKILPSASGLPDDWNKEMELRLGYLEAQDEAREPKLMIKVLKREFPALAKLKSASAAKEVMSAETLLRWIDWLDRQEGPRGDSYRAGLAAGQVTVQESLEAKGIELDSMNLNRSSKSNHTTKPGSHTNEGVRLVDSDIGIDGDVIAAAGGLESIIDDNSPSTSSNLTASASQQAMYRNRIRNAPGSPLASTAPGLVTHQPRSSDSWTRQADQDAQVIHELGNTPSCSPSVSPKTQPKSSSTTSGSAYFPGTAASSSFSSSPNTPGAISQKPGSTSTAHSQTPRRSKSAKDGIAGSFTRSATARSATETLIRTRNGLGISSKSATQGLRERRQLGELNVGIIPPSRSLQALPEIRGKENRRSPPTPAGNSATSIGLRARIMAKWSRT